MPIPQPRKTEKESDFTTRCMADETMVSEYQNRDQRVAICKQSWKDRNKTPNLNSRFLEFSINLTTLGRDETINGTLHRVYPVTMLVEGVHHGAVGSPAFYPSAVLQQCASQWNGMPVPVFHPQDQEGNYISANSDGVQSIGFIRNTFYDGGKLKAEVCIDVNVAKVLRESIIDELDSGTMEVSTGLFAEVNESAGKWNDEDYAVEILSITPDHLALLPGQTGACSRNDGCGIRPHAKLTVNFKHNNSVADSEPSWGSVDKTKLPRVAFANMGSEGQKSTWGYPHHWVQGGGNPSDAGVYTTGTMYLHKGGLNAAWAAAQGARSGQEASSAIKSHLDAHRRAIRVQEAISSIDVNVEPEEYLAKIAMATAEAGVYADKYDLLSAVKISANETSHDEIRNQLGRYVDSLDSPRSEKQEIYKINYIEAVFPMYFIYREESNLGTRLYKQFYTEQNGRVTIDTMRVEVYKKTEYLPVQGNSKGEKQMANKEPCCPEKVRALIANKNTTFNDADAEWLEGLTADQLGHFEAMAEAATKKEGPITMESYLAAAPPKIREVLNAGLKQLDKARTEMIATILANEANPFTEEQLKSMDDTALAGIAALAAKPAVSHQYSYLGQGGGGVTGTGKTEEEPYVMTSLNFDSPTQ